MVLRGSQVRASLRAASRLDRKLRVYAVEKNPNAVAHLRALALQQRWPEGLVTIVSCDMRSWAAAEQADILVSELLGSFGDNELSPECLDGAQRFLKPDGVSIPQSCVPARPRVCSVHDRGPYHLNNARPGPCIRRVRLSCALSTFAHECA